MGERKMKHYAPTSLAEVAYSYDVVLSDFGRAPALKLLQTAAVIERALVERILLSHYGRQAPFFDEYRRIMFSAIGDVAYIKRDLISSYEHDDSQLDARVLFGVQGTEIGANHVAAICDVLVEPVQSAIRRGYRSIRIVIPCNTMGLIEEELRSELNGRLPHVSCRTVGLQSEAPGGRRESPVPVVSIYSLPRVVVHHVLSGLPSASLLVLGTKLARDSYARVADSLDSEDVVIVPVAHNHQVLMDDLLLASIREDRADVAVLTNALEHEVVRPMRQRYGSSLVVVQASTDYDINVGTSSLRLLADQLVLDVYGSNLWREADAGSLHVDSSSSSK